MDSLTQIVLGAAVGEVALGKKIGNKAMLWGAIAGTIPDLDVYQSLFFDALTANELHRGFSHSILFSLVFAPIVAWLARTKEKWSLVGFISLILGYPFLSVDNSVVRIVLFAIWLILVVITIKHSYGTHSASQRDWTKLMFWSLVTHPLLDCHTTWGTQLLWPLPYKLAWNNIFVVDPFYTVPFLICVVIALCYHRESKKRKYFNRVGIILSSIYMLWSLGAKYHTYSIFQDNLQQQNIAYTRLTTVPTPLNTVLWSATAETDSAYYTGLYSLLDDDEIIQFHKIENNHALIEEWEEEDLINRLNFLSKGWYVVNDENPDTLVYNDARFGPMYASDTPMYGFGYQLFMNNSNILSVTQQRPDIDEETGEQMLSILWRRIWGKNISQK